MAELADASDLGSDGRPWGFKSLRLHQRNPRQKSGVSLCREGLFSLWLTRSALRATIAIPSLCSLQIPSTAPAQLPTKVGGFSLPRRAFFPVLTRKVFIRGVVGMADCGYKVIYIVRRYGIPDPVRIIPVWHGRGGYKIGTAFAVPWVVFSGDHFLSAWSRFQRLISSRRVLNLPSTPSSVGE